jgi:hypothetical protein
VIQQLFSWKESNWRDNVAVILHSLTIYQCLHNIKAGSTFQGLELTGIKFSTSHKFNFRHVGVFESLSTMFHWHDVHNLQERTEMDNLIKYFRLRIPYKSHRKTIRHSYVQHAASSYVWREFSVVTRLTRMRSVGLHTSNPDRVSCLSHGPHIVNLVRSQIIISVVFQSYSESYIMLLLMKKQTEVCIAIGLVASRLSL